MAQQERAKYDVQIGKEIISFEGPAGLSDSQIEALADKHLKSAKPGQVFSHSQYAGTTGEPDAHHSPEDSSAMGSFLRNLPHDATFGLDDPVAAAVNAVVPYSADMENAAGTSGGHQVNMKDANGFWDAFSKNRADYRAQRAADTELHPNATIAGRVGGVLATIPAAAERIGAALPGAIRDFAKARPVLSTTLASGATTGVTSAAEAEPGKSWQSGVLGTALGLGLGPAAHAASELVPMVAKYGRIFFNKASHSEAIQQIVKALHRDGFDVTSPEGVAKVQSALEEYGGKPVALADIGTATRSRAGVGLRSPSKVQQQSIDAVTARQAGQGTRLAKDVRATVAPRTDVHALDEELSAQRAETAKALRDKALFVDAPVEPSVVRGEAPKAGVLRTVETSAAPRDAANNNGASVAEWPTAPEAMNSEEGLARWRKYPYHSDAQVNTPEGRGTIFASSVDNIADGVPASGDVIIKLNDSGETIKVPAHQVSSIYEKPKFEAVTGGGNAAPPPSAQATGRISRVVDDPTLQQLARLPLAQKALKAATEQATAERDLLATTGKSIDHLPDINTGSQLDVRTFDNLKRFLDDEVNRLYKRGDTATFSAAQANQVKDLRNAVRDRLRTAVPEYGDYLDAYKGSSEMIDALGEGRNFTNLDPEELAATQGKRSEAGQEMFRTGAARNLLDRIRATKDSGNAASNILRSDEERAQLEAIGVDPLGLGKLGRSVQQERRMNLLPAEVSGSQTAQRAAAAEDAAGGSHLGLPFNPASKFGWMGLIGRTIANRASVNRNAAINEELLPRLLETSLSGQEAILRELEQSGKADVAQKLRRQIRTRRAVTASGPVIGGAVAINQEDDSGY